MTESTQLQTTENSKAGVVKMEPPPPTTSSGANVGTAVPAPSTLIEQHQQQYALKWNDFQTSILNSFRHLRDEEDFVDVTLACEQRSFMAHKVVLSACSPYFRKLLKANPCDHPIVILRDVCSDDVENLLSFMYNGEVNVSHEQLPEFLKTAQLLQIRGLTDVSCGFPVGLSATTKSFAAAFTTNNNNPNSNNNNNSKSNFQLAAPFDHDNHGNIGTSYHNNNCNIITSHFIAPSMAVAAAASATAATLLAGAVPVGSGACLSGSSASNPPAIQELKASSASPANHPWDLADSDSNRNSHLTPPPQKRIKSADLFRAQHGISPERLLLDREFPVAGQHPLTRERRDRSRATSNDRDRSLDLRDSLLGQALDNSHCQIAGNQVSRASKWPSVLQNVSKLMHSVYPRCGDQKQHADLGSLHAQSAGEDSNSSDTEPSDQGEAQHDGTTMDSMNGSVDNQRSHSFPSAFLGLQNIPGLLPGPSAIGANDFVSRRSLEMRVRATDPRPCPKCGKIYRSAHTLRTHLEDKHTVCPGYRCVLCGTVAKSRNSLHSHMSRQHRGISTKDLPVLPMPSAFDPEMASRLLAKAGVKISPAELRARASPTSSGNGSSQPKLDVSGGASGGTQDDIDDDSDDDPEDLTTGNSIYGIGSIGGISVSSGNSAGGSDLSRYHESLLSNFGHANTTISRIRNEAAAAAAAAAALGQQKDLAGVQISTSTAAGQSLLDTYLQFITENTFGIGISQEHAATAALHAAKMAQLNALGHGLDKLAPGLLPAPFDITKISASNFAANNGGLTIEPMMSRDKVNHLSPSDKSISVATATTSASTAGDPEAVVINRDSSEPMDLGLDNKSRSNNIDGAHSDADDNYSDDEGMHKT